jgi:glycogen debranching enzyme
MDEKDSNRRGLLPRYTLKDADTFLLSDALGDLQHEYDGLFSNDTRLLSKLQLLVGHNTPSLLGAAISKDNTLFTAHMTYRPLAVLSELAIPHGVIHLERSRVLWMGRIFERLKLTNFSELDARVPVKMSFAADFADIFEVQGQLRRQRGQCAAPEVSAQKVTLSYCGLDGILRRACVQVSWEPLSLTAAAADTEVTLNPASSVSLFVEIGGDAGPAPSAQRFDAALLQLTAARAESLGRGASVTTSARLFNEWLDRSRADLSLLTTMLPTGLYPYAGIPWFATQFGRDGIVTALQTLWIDPSIAAGVLRFLASTQAHEESSFRDSQPGKIMHETRRGEMASLGEVPFGRYYGGVDTTPLFILLAGEYDCRTGDHQLIDEIWDALLAATEWVERRLAQSPTGFLDYARGEKSGLANQGWKDSQDSIFHADGRFPVGPVAVVEVQGYAYAALRCMSALAGRRGEEVRHATWRLRADELRAAIEAKFWIPDMGFYALALDGEGKPCCVTASNAGHLLYCGVPAEDRAAMVADRLCANEFVTGWGIRTLAQGEPRYNPMSYHNGSVWPHDTSLCAAGMARYGHRGRVVQILNEIFESANHFGMRLPELYCGFARVAGQGPVAYPVACLPQAWASGAAFMLLQACLGIEVNGHSRTVRIRRPALPQGIGTLEIRRLPVGNRTIDLEFQRLGEEIVVAPSKHKQAGVAVVADL